MGLASVGCGGSQSGSPGGGRLAPDLLPLRAGRTPAFRLPAAGSAVKRRLPVDGLPCRRASARARGVHLELYARRLVVPVPAGIGLAPPLRRSGAYVRGGACSYPVRTYEPTGVIVVDQPRGLSLANLFAVWGQPLSANRLAGFHGRVRAYVGGRRWTRAPGRIPLAPHTEIVLEIGAFVPPHPRYLFPPGL
jgi:hypothetical protein